MLFYLLFLFLAIIFQHTQNLQGQSFWESDTWSIVTRLKDPFNSFPNSMSLVQSFWLY